MCPQGRDFQSEFEDGSEFHPQQLQLSSRDVEFEGNILLSVSVFLTHRAPGSCHKNPERQSAITYDYSEEELMASIEREYCC